MLPEGGWGRGWEWGAHDLLLLNFFVVVEILVVLESGGWAGPALAPPPGRGLRGRGDFGPGLAPAGRGLGGPARRARGGRGDGGGWLQNKVYLF